MNTFTITIDGQPVEVAEGETILGAAREIGLDIQKKDFTVVGIGEMSGDVFGNGMLLSKHIRLLAAFDHRHIFLDPGADAASGFTARERVYNLPRSSWAPAAGPCVRGR